MLPVAAQELRLKSKVSVKKVLPGRVAFSPDGRILAVSGQTGEGSVEPKAGGQFSMRLTNVERVVVLVDAGSFKVRKQLMKEPDQDIFGSSPVEFSADGQRLFTLADSSIRVWDTQDGKRIGTWGQKIARLVFSPDRRYALARLLEGTYEAFDLRDGRSLGAFPKSDEGELVIVDADHPYLAFFREPNLVLRNLKSGEEAVLGESALKRLTGAALSLDAGTLAVTGESGIVAIWNLSEKKKVSEQPASGGDGAYSPVFAPDGSALAYRAGKKLHYWGLHSKLLLTQDPQHVMALGKISFGNDAQTLATTGMMMDPFAKIWTVTPPSR
ncbi:MAG: WD40 repeat domain-containing protein [Terriglobales bacterium]